MAYMSQERKAAIVAKAKPICAKYGVKATFGVRHHSTLVVNIASGSLDFFADINTDYAGRNYSGTYIDVNPYHWDRQYLGRTLEFFKELFPVLNEGNHDNSDITTDYFDVGWYVDVNVGQWNKPYVLTGAKVAA